MNLQAPLLRINWHQTYRFATQWLGFSACLAATAKTVTWYNLIGWPALLHNGHLLLVSLFFGVFALTFAYTCPHRAALAAAGGILTAIIL